MSLKTQLLIYLLAMALFDVIIPIPITAMALIFVLYQKPRWFKEVGRYRIQGLRAVRVRFHEQVQE